MDKNNYTYKCYKCDNIMKYVEDKAMEDLEWLRFKCTKCDEEILVPENNPYINK